MILEFSRYFFRRVEARREVPLPDSFQEVDIRRRVSDMHQPHSRPVMRRPSAFNQCLNDDWLGRKSTDAPRTTNCVALSRQLVKGAGYPSSSQIHQHKAQTGDVALQGLDCLSLVNGDLRAWRLTLSVVNSLIFLQKSPRGLDAQPQTPTQSPPTPKPPTLLQPRTLNHMSWSQTKHQSL
jgi:hypothetical protein